MSQNNFTEYCFEPLKNSRSVRQLLLILSESSEVCLWVPGRRSKRIAQWILVSALVCIVVSSSTFPYFPNIISALFPTPTNGTMTVQSQSTRSSAVASDDGPGVPLPPGTVQAGSRNGPVMSQVVDSSIPPHLTTTAKEFIYQTSYGIYSFNRSFPFIFSLRSPSGTPLTTASFFFVTASAPPLFPGSATVTQATDTQFQVSYEVRSGSIVVGNLLLQVDFQASARPKFTVGFSKSSPWNLGDFHIVWATFTVQMWLKTSATTAVDIRSISGVQTIAGSPRVDVGPSADTSTWARGSSFTIGTTFSKHLEQSPRARQVLR